MTYDRYGSFDVLSLRDVAEPPVGRGGVLVRVQAAGLHVGDCFGVHGAPYLMRAMTGILRPKHGIPGHDLAGVVVAVGEGVTRFAPGDEVFGYANGTCAEYVVAGDDMLALKPANLTFEEAAALATSGLAALHGLRDAGALKAGQRVLIIGASGGVGSFAVQIAKALGAHVTGVCSAQNSEMVRALGADAVIDYARDDFSQVDPKYDLILDNVENRSLADCRRALTPKGTLVLNSGTGAKGPAMLLRMFRPLVLSPFVRQALRRFLSRPNHTDLVVLKDMTESGALRPVIERVYPLAEVGAALMHIESGHARGKVIVTVQAAASSSHGEMSLRDAESAVPN